MRNLGDMNDLDNAQDVILLCKIIENRFQQMQEKFGYNPRKCNSTSTLSGSVQRDLSKEIIALPTKTEHTEVFERSLIGGYNCVNTRLGFDTEVLLPNLTQAEYAKINIGQSFQAYKNQNFKTGYKLKLDNDEKYKDYRLTSKIIKFGENNQYGFAMTKPMAIGSIKDKIPSWAEFNLLMGKVSLDDPIGHLFVVHIEFDHEHTTDAQIMYNEMMPPITEKEATIEPNKRSVFQLLELYAEDNKGMPKNYKVSPKAQATLLRKRNIPMYLEEPKIVIYRCGWKITKLYRHYYFEQERFKKDFILMNQKASQESKNIIESDFCKLLNNANFGYDCRNNLDNWSFEPISDEIRELSFIRRYHNNLFDKELAPFITSHILEQEISHKYDSGRQKVVDFDSFFAAKTRSIENRKAAKLKRLKISKNVKKQTNKRTVLHDYSERMDAANKNIKVKTVIDFIDQDTASIKAFGVKTNDKVKITARFIKGKVLMFSKISLKACVYDLILFVVQVKKYKKDTLEMTL